MRLCSHLIRKKGAHVSYIFDRCHGRRHIAISAMAFAQQGGTAQEARAMLDKAVTALKADRDLALVMFNKGRAASGIATSIRSASG
jgi:hypothetical protein